MNSSLKPVHISHTITENYISIDFQKFNCTDFFVCIFIKKLAKFKLWELIFIFGGFKNELTISFKSVLEVQNPWPQFCFFTIHFISDDFPMVVMQTLHSLDIIYMEVNWDFFRLDLMLLFFLWLESLDGKFLHTDFGAWVCHFFSWQFQISFLCVCFSFFSIFEFEFICFLTFLATDF